MSEKIHIDDGSSEGSPKGENDKSNTTGPSKVKKKKSGLLRHSFSGETPSKDPRSTFYRMGAIDEKNTTNISSAQITLKRRKSEDFTAQREGSAILQALNNGKARSEENIRAIIKLQSAGRKTRKKVTFRNPLTEELGEGSATAEYTESDWSNADASIYDGGSCGNSIYKPISVLKPGREIKRLARKRGENVNEVCAPISCTCF